MARAELQKKALTQIEFEELIRVVKDPFFFSTFIKVIHPIKGRVRFDLYPFQVKVLWCFIKHRFNIILKFRQAGITELISMFCLWLAMFHSDKNIVIISIKDRVAKKVLRKIKYMYRNLPDHLKVPTTNGRGLDIGTASELIFSNGSTITSIPTTEEAGRSEALSLVVIDEAAIVRWANQIWAAIFPTLSTGGSAILNSTPFGTANWFHKMWVEANSGGNGFIPIRLRWWMHPERDQSWYDEMRRALGPRRTAQEIDGDFLTSGSSVFDLADIKAIEDTLADYPPIEVRENGGLLIFNKPEKDNKYWIGADVSTGRSRDYSTFTIFDRFGEEVACFKKRIPIDKFSDLLLKEGRKYNNAYLAPESNDIGLAVTSKIQAEGYKNLYYTEAALKKQGESRLKKELIPGWLTTRRNRPVIIGGLEEDIRLNNIIVKDPFFVQEAYTFIYDEGNRAVAMGKGKKSQNAEEDLTDETYTDDAILGKAIANHIRKASQRGPLILPV